MASNDELIGLAERMFEANPTGAAEQVAVKLANSMDKLQHQLTMASRALEAGARYITEHDCDDGECYNLADWQDAFVRAINAGVPASQPKRDVETDYV